METELERLRRENGALKKALTPSGETKYVHIGEYKFTETITQVDEDGELDIELTVPWLTVKEIMAAILKHANTKIAMGPEVSEGDKEFYWKDRMSGQFTQEELNRQDKL